MNRVICRGILLMVLFGCQDGSVVNLTDYRGAAVVHGQINSAGGDPVSGVAVTVITHPESCEDGQGEALEGESASQSDGSFWGEFGVTGGQPIDFTSACTEVVATPPEGSAFLQQRVAGGSLRITWPIADSMRVELELDEESGS